jgi:hypothetical protein
MAKGESGRIVLEVDTKLKKTLYSILALEEMTLKDWFVKSAEAHIKEKRMDLIKSIEQDEHEI